MKEQLITFETAKLAKEKGFNIFTIEVWLESKRFDSPIESINSNMTNGGYGDDVIQYFRPTQSILQKWLREVHNIHVYCFPECRTIPHYQVFVVSEQHKTFEVNEEYTMRYEQALEAGLQEALKLIES